MPALPGAAALLAAALLLPALPALARVDLPPDGKAGQERVVASGAPVARLIIPRLAMDEIVVEGVGERSLRVGPGHLTGSALPGEAGNAVVSAHRDRHFSRLDELEPGDSAITLAAGHTVRWRVTARRVVERDAPALFTSREPRLTLTTCWPVRYLGPAPDRLVVTLEPAP